MNNCLKIEWLSWSGVYGCRGKINFHLGLRGKVVCYFSCWWLLLSLEPQDPDFVVVFNDPVKSTSLWTWWWVIKFHISGVIVHLIRTLVWLKAGNRFLSSGKVRAQKEGFVFALWAGSSGALELCRLLSELPRYFALAAGHCRPLVGKHPVLCSVPWSSFLAVIRNLWVEQSSTKPISTCQDSELVISFPSLLGGKKRMSIICFTQELDEILPLKFIVFSSLNWKMGNRISKWNSQFLNRSWSLSETGEFQNMYYFLRSEISILKITLYQNTTQFPCWESWSRSIYAPNSLIKRQKCLSNMMEFP